MASSDRQQSITLMNTHAKVLTLVQVSYSHDQQNLVSNINIAFHKQETIGIMGPAQSGKSTLLKLCAGLIYPSSGNVLATHSNTTVGMVFQNNALFDSMTVFDNLAFPLRMRTQLPESDIKDQVFQWLTRFDLMHACDLLPLMLSGGMKKKVAILRAHMCHPNICLYDEPTSGLDPQSQIQVSQLLKDHIGHKTSTTLIASHDIEFLMQHCQRIIFLHQGSIQYDGPKESLHQHPQVAHFLKGSGIFEFYNT